MNVVRDEELTNTKLRKGPKQQHDSNTGHFFKGAIVLMSEIEKEIVA